MLLSRKGIKSLEKQYVYKVSVTWFAGAGNPYKPLVEITSPEGQKCSVQTRIKPIEMITFGAQEAESAWSGARKTLEEPVLEQFVS